MAQKKLESDSSYNELDLDGDGIVSDSELAAAAALSNMKSRTPREEWHGLPWDP